MWLLFGLGTAFFEAVKDVLSKRAMRELDPYSVAFAMPLFALPVLLLYAARATWPPLDATFYIALLTAASMHVWALSLYMKALESAPLAVSLPMIAFTPLFIMLFGPFISGDLPSAQGAVGVLLIVAGTYLLNIGRRATGFLEPFKALARERGAIYMLTVAAIWGVTGLIDRIGVRHSSVHCWAAAIVTTTTLFFLTLLAFTGRLGPLRTARFYRSAALPGLMNGLSLLFYMEGIALTIAAYVISAKRLSILFGMVLGYYFLGERNIREKLAGAALMVGGVVVISLA